MKFIKGEKNDGILQPPVMPHDALMTAYTMESVRCYVPPVVLPKRSNLSPEQSLVPATNL